MYFTGTQRGGSGARPKRERSEREGRVACNRGLCGLWLEKTEITQTTVNRMAERSRAAVSPKAEYIILSCVVVGALAGRVVFS